MAPLVRGRRRPPRVGLPAVLLHQGDRPGGRLPGRRASVWRPAPGSSTSAAGPAATPTPSVGRGFEVVGVDISERFVALAREGTPAGAAVTFERADARALRLRLRVRRRDLPVPGRLRALRWRPAWRGSTRDRAVLDGMARALRPGGRLALTAFSAYFQLRFLGEADSFDAERGVNHEHTAVNVTRTAARRRPTCGRPASPPGSCGLLAEAAGLRSRPVWSVTPGDYAARPPRPRTPEFLLARPRPVPGRSD